MFNFMVTNEGGLTTAGYAIAIIAGIILFLAAICFAGKHSEKHKLTTRQLVFCAVAMALAFITSYLWRRHRHHRWSCLRNPAVHSGTICTFLLPGLL